MTDFSNTVLITDLDGTLLPHSKAVSEKDLAAIEKFKKGGGIFTIATGRIYQATEQFFDVLKPNAPVILNNGGLIYDTEKKEAVYSCFLDSEAVSYTIELMKHFPDLGVEIDTLDNIYVVNMTELEKLHLTITNLPYTEKNIDEIKTEKWCKVLYSIDSSRIHELKEFTASMNWDKAEFVASGSFLFECLPKNCTKGSALKRLAEISNWSKFTIAAAGDYDNDLAMLEYADICFAPQNAQETLKNAAAYVTSATCNEGAIAEAIDYIENCVK